MMVLRVFDEDEGINGKDGNKDHHGVENRASCQNDTDLATLVSKKFVIERIKPEVRVVLHLVEALGTPVDSCFGQADEEGHQDE